MNRPDLHLHLDAYLSVREALGFQMRAARTLLRDFVQLCGKRCRSPAPSGRSWLSIGPAPPRRTRGAEWRLPTSEYGAGLPGVSAGHAPRDRSPCPRCRRVRPPSRAVSLDDGADSGLMRAAHQAGPQGALRPHTLSTVIGLLASTGLRVGEALRLTLADVHLESAPPFLHIRETKFHKSRLVPLHPSTATQLRSYLSHEGHSGATTRCLMWCLSPSRDTCSAIKRLGTGLPRCAGGSRIEPSPGGRRPSLQALRHRFAIERIRQWYRDGVDVQALLPTLSVYLGHLRPQESYWYLTATPELLTAAAARFQRYAMEGESR